MVLTTAIYFAVGALSAVSIYSELCLRNVARTGFGQFDVHPITWAVALFFFWPLVAPVYLIERRNILKRGQDQSSSRAANGRISRALIGFPLAAACIALTVHAVFASPAECDRPALRSALTRVLMEQSGGSARIAVREISQGPIDPALSHQLCRATVDVGSIQRPEMPPASVEVHFQLYEREGLPRILILPFIR